MTREEAIRRCKKLAAFKDGRATPHEVAIAADLLQKTLRKYHLSMADLESGLREEGCIELELFVFRRIEPWRVHMVAVIAECFECQVVEKRYADGRRAAQLFGMKSDAEVAEYYIQAVIAASLPRAKEINKAMVQMVGNAHAREYLNSYMIGIADGISQQLKGANQTMEEKALIVTKGALVTDFLRSRYQVKDGEPPKKRVSIYQSAYQSGVNTGRSTKVAPALTNGA